MVGKSPLPCPSPISKGTPACAARSASPEASMKARARIAPRPDLVSTISASILSAVHCSTAAAQRVEQELHARVQQQLVGRAFVGRDVVGAHADAALQPSCGALRPPSRVDALEQVVGHAMHQLRDLAVATCRRGRRNWSRRRRCPCRRENRSARPADVARRAARRGRGRDAGRPTADHDDLVLDKDGHRTGGFADHVSARQAARARAATGRCR